MQSSLQLQVGSRVRIRPAHWIRAHSWGTVREFYPKFDHNPYRVEFDEPGAGFTEGEGKCLWLSEYDFDVVKGKTQE